MAVSNTVGTGGDYPTLAAWEDAVDHTTGDSKTARVLSNVDVGGVNITGWTNTPTATNFVLIVNDAAGDLHSLTQASGSSSARITSAIAARNLLIQEPYVTVDGIYLDNSGFSATASQLDTRAGNTVAKNCYFDHNPDANIACIGTSSGTPTPTTLENNVFLINNGTNAQTSAIIDTALDDVTVKNCVAYCTGTAATQRGFQNASGTTWTIYSTALFGFSDNWSTGTFAGDYNAEDGDDPERPGADVNAQLSLTATDEFTAPASGDFTLKAGSNLIGAGDPSNSTATSYDGTTRSSPDIGPDEFSAGSTVSLTGTTAATSSTSGDIDQTIAIAGTTAAASTTVGDIDQTIALVGSTAAASSTIGVITTYVHLDGLTASAGTTLGALTVAVNIPLAGSTAATSTTAGDIDQTIAIAGTTGATSTTVGDIDQTIALAGLSSVSTTTTAALIMTQALSGITAGVSTTVATLGVQGNLELPVDVIAAEIYTPGALAAEIYTPYGVAGGVYTPHGAAAEMWP